MLPGPFLLSSFTQHHACCSHADLLLIALTGPPSQAVLGLQGTICLTLLASSYLPFRRSLKRPFLREIFPKPPDWVSSVGRLGSRFLHGTSQSLVIVLLVYLILICVFPTSHPLYPKYLANGINIQDKRVEEDGQALLTVVSVLICLKREVHLHFLCSVSSPCQRPTLAKRSGLVCRRV